MTDKKPLKEAAFCIGVHWRTLYRWTLEGKVVFIQSHIGSPIYISEDEIERLVKKKSNGCYPKIKSEIYFIQADINGLIAIGFTQSLETQLDSIKTSSPVPISILAIIDGDFRKETELHEKFSSLRKYGEWFEPAPELIAFIKTLPTITT